MSSCYGESIAGRALRAVFGSHIAVESLTEARRAKKYDCRNIVRRGPYASVAEHLTILGPKYITQLMSNVYIQLQNKRCASMRRNRENRFETAQQAGLVQEQLNKCIPVTAQLRVPGNQQSAR